MTDEKVDLMPPQETHNPKSGIVWSIGRSQPSKLFISNAKIIECSDFNLILRIVV